MGIYNAHKFIMVSFNKVTIIPGAVCVLLWAVLSMMMCHDAQDKHVLATLKLDLIAVS